MKTPRRRHNSLIPLSREHQYALMLCLCPLLFSSFLLEQPCHALNDCALVVGSLTQHVGNFARLMFPAGPKSRPNPCCF